MAASLRPGACTIAERIAVIRASRAADSVSDSNRSGPEACIDAEKNSSAVSTMTASDGSKMRHVDCDPGKLGSVARRPWPPPGESIVPPLAPANEPRRGLAPVALVFVSVSSALTAFATFRCCRRTTTTNSSLTVDLIIPARSLAQPNEPLAQNGSADTAFSSDACLAGSYQRQRSSDRRRAGVT